ncbi:uncharacterized protein NECHADRAFT_98887 [Fusarium vanettenii 77-13-4]|uniref:Uncharacterized protein n=1 Tax=Fusarium vanettenii (strain ATCC MYA-4622 / CBS 123669 / FGSC 9596 / NRRL 45880 / 77-13-4) TaxID=660122 RepID=C7YHX2_FUSV7|nr:uncharacterized protein NECHADRAFT_98887 [Fusarium vanettenii 77-13-4]EEU48709.1 predicted protein [Fusarium vanettenii 77-13-4]
MESRPPATSIFELLTAKNPELVQIEPANKTLTHSPHYFYPKELQPWDEFNFETLEDIFAGALLREARQNGRSLPAYPTLIPKLDCVITEEDSVTSLIVKWNESIVNMALISVQDQFNPSLWNSKKRKHEKQDAEPLPARRGKRRQPPRRSSQSNRVQKPKKHRLSALRPDSGAVYHALSPEEHASPKTKERFPKEYKPATKWCSEKFFRSGFLNNKGKVRKGMIMQNYCMPIRQAFTYCVTHACRYGCILTCGEAFIFRLTKLEKKAAESQEALTKSLRDDGLLEYVSIPWANHYQGDIDSYKDLTVNLAMWFVHVLAGNQYWVDWKYCPLTEEEPKAGRLSEATTEPSFESRESEDESDSSETTAPLGYTPVSVKDGEFSVGEDAIHWSFSERHDFTK